MFSDVFDGWLDQREHRGDTFIEVGEADGIDVGFIDRYFHLQRSVVERECRGIGSGGILPFGSGICLLFFSAGTEHKYEQDDQKYAECSENGGVNDFFHMQNYDFGFRTHEVPSKVHF